MTPHSPTLFFAPGEVLLALQKFLLRATTYPHVCSRSLRHCVSLSLFRRTVYAAVAKAAGGNDEIAGMEMEEGACDVNFYANGALPPSLARSCRINLAAKLG